MSARPSGASPASADSEKADYRRAAGGERERERPDCGSDARPRDVPRQIPHNLKAAHAARRAAADREEESQRPGDNPPLNRAAASERDRREPQAEKEPYRRADRDCQQMVRLHSRAPLIRAAKKPPPKRTARPLAERIGEESSREESGRKRMMERETGFEPATACLEGRNSTTELLPPAATISVLGIAARVNSGEEKASVPKKENV